MKHSVRFCLTELGRTFRGRNTAPTNGELLRRIGKTDEARSAYERALTLTHQITERRFLEKRLVEITAESFPPEL